MAAGKNFLPFPIYGAAICIQFPWLDADGDLVPGVTGADALVSKDIGTYAACTNEATEVATDSGMHYLDLTYLEQQADCVGVISKGDGVKTTPIVMYPRRLPSIRTGTCQAPSAIETKCKLDASASAKDDFYIGCYVHLTGNTGIGQARLVTDYDGATRECTVAPNWATDPDNTTTFSILVPETAMCAAWAGVQIADPDTAGYVKTTIKDGTGTGELDTASGVVKADLVSILATALTETGGYLAAGFKKFFNIQTPVATVESVDQTGNSYAVVSHADHGNAKLVRSTTPANALTVDAAGLADANAVKLGPSGSGTAQTARNIGANVLLSSGSGTGQLDFSSGVVKSNLAQILGTALTETAGLIAAGFKKLFNIATPLLTVASPMRGTDSANTTVPDAAGAAATLHGVTDGLIGAIPTTAMRGTDNAALASLVTVARMGALTDLIDGGRLDLLLDAIPTTAMRGTDSANTTVPDAAGVAAALHAITDALIAAISGDATAANQALLLEDLVDIKGTSFVKDTNSLVNVTGAAATHVQVGGQDITIEDSSS